MRLSTLLILLLLVILISSCGNANAADTVAAAPVATLQDSLVTIIQQVQSGVSAGVNFLQAEIPDVIRQLLVWKLVEAAFWAGTQLLAGLVGLFLICRGIQVIYTNNRLEAIAQAADKSMARSSYREEGYAALRDAYQEARREASAHDSILIARCILGVIGVGCLIACVSNIGDNILTAVQIWIAPKVYLIEYAAQLVK